MTINRRDFLKKTGLGLGGLLVQPDVSKLRLSSESSTESAGMLFDASKCVGCTECQVACKVRLNSLNPDEDISEYDLDPRDLSAYTWSLIKLYKDETDDSRSSFVKVQCMHCLHPACVSVCPVGALTKSEIGPVVYDDKKCFGCRYCMAACPFDIPKYQWDKVFPLIQKCDFCADRQEAGLQPVCSSVCPTGALLFGKREELLEIARERIKNDSRYVDHIYGEHEVGGTAQLYISHVPFELLGFQALSAVSLAGLTWPWMAAVPGIAVVVTSLMGGIYWFTKKRNQAQEEKKEE
jgi:formate dehydrogenase iron-sulfur subunit